MTDPKHLDALVTELRDQANKLAALWPDHTADAITALRAQIDRERAATIEAAAEVIDTCNAEGPYQAIGAASRIRALHTDATRAAMDAIRREGYAAGAGEERAKSADLANAARDLADCCQLGEDADWEEGEDPLSALRAVLADITPPKTDRSEITP